MGKNKSEFHWILSQSMERARYPFNAKGKSTGDDPSKILLSALLSQLTVLSPFTIQKRICWLELREN